MMRLARKKIGLSTDEVTMVGDTMETDIRGATDLGFRSVLVLTGSTRREELASYPYAPTLVVESIADLEPEEGGTRSKKSRARLRGAGARQGPRVDPRAKASRL